MLQLRWAHLTGNGVAVMIKMDCDLGLPVSLSEIKGKLPADAADFDPELYHGLKVKWPGMKIIVFRTGKLMIVPMLNANNINEMSLDPVSCVRQQAQSFFDLVVQIMQAKRELVFCEYTPATKRQKKMQ